MAWVEIARRLSTSIIKLWRWRKRGVLPNMHQLSVLQDLADSMDFGLCFQLQESVGQTREYEEVITMQDRLLRRREVERITSMSRASIYRLMRSGSFPLPVKVGSTAVRWKESDIADWIESRPLATGDLCSTTSA